jgi:hypothetical protein
MLSGTSVVLAQAPFRAQVEWARIQDKPTSIQLDRRGVTQAAQTVRIELDNTISNATSDAGDSTSRRATIFGIKDHPTLPDTDIRLWDVFILDSVEYTVTQVNRQMHGAIQAYAEGVG